jgi:hypothetical protein
MTFLFTAFALEVDAFLPSPAFAHSRNGLVARMPTADAAADAVTASPSMLLPLRAAEGESHEPGVVYDADASSAFSKYKKLHAKSIRNPSKFWAEQARERLS